SPVNGTGEAAPGPAPAVNGGPKTAPREARGTGLKKPTATRQLLPDRGSGAAQAEAGGVRGRQLLPAGRVAEQPHPEARERGAHFAAAIDPNLGRFGGRQLPPAAGVLEAPHPLAGEGRGDDAVARNGQGGGVRRG